MKILKQTCVSAEIVIKEVYKIGTEYMGTPVSLTIYCEDNKMNQVLWHLDPSINIPFRERDKFYKLIEKALGKTL